MSTTNAASPTSDDDDDTIPLSQLFSTSYRLRQSPPLKPRVQPRPRRLPFPPPPLIYRANLGNGDLVWAKVFPFTYRPGVILRCKKKRRFLVSFFKDEDEEPQWFQEAKVVGFEENCVRMIGICGRKVRKEIACALEEFGARTVLGLRCSAGNVKINAEEVSRVRKGFVPSNLVRFVRGKGVFCSVLDGDINKDEDGGLEMVRLTAQVVAFRRVVTFGAIVRNFASGKLLGSVRELGIGFVRFSLDAAYWEDMIERILAFRRFLSVTPGRVFRELVETGGGLFEDDSGSSTSESSSGSSGGGMSICEGNKLQSLSDSFSGISSSSGCSFDEQEVPQSSRGFGLGGNLAKDLMVDDYEMSDAYETLGTSAGESLPPVRYSTNEELPSHNSNSLFLREVLNDLYIIATDLCYFGVEKCESVYGCILTYRNLTGVGSTSNADHPYKLRRRNKLMDEKPERRFSFSVHTFQNDEVDMIKRSDRLIGDVGLSACDNLDKNTSVYIDDCTSVTVDKCQEVLDDLLVYQIDQSDEIKSLESVVEEIDDGIKHADSRSESKNKQEGLVVVTAVNKLNALFITPNSSSVEPLPERVSSLSECKSSYARKMLMQLHSIAANPSFMGHGKCKTMYRKWLKIRELIYQNNSCFLSKRNRILSDHLMKPSDKMSMSIMKNEQLVELDGNMNNDQVNDYIISGNCMLGGPDPCIFKHGSVPRRSVSSGSTLFTEKDGLGVVSSLCIANRACPLSWIPENQVPKSEVINRTTLVTPIISPPICVLLSQICLLAIDVYHPGVKRVKLVRRSILRYRTLVFQNIQDLSSPTNCNMCSPSAEEFQLCTSDKLDDNCVTGTCAGDMSGSVNKPKVYAALVHTALTENELGDKARTRNTFTVDSQSSIAVHRNVDENRCSSGYYSGRLNLSLGDASRSYDDSLEKSMIDQKTAFVSIPESLSSRCFNSEVSLASMNIKDPSFQTNIKNLCAKVEKFQVPTCDKPMHDSSIIGTCKRNKPSDVNVPNKDAQFVPCALNVNEQRDKVKAGDSTNDAIDFRSTLILHINADANRISCENHSEKSDIPLGNSSRSCDENMMMEQPASIGNLEELNFLCVGSEHDLNFDSNRKSSAVTDVITWTPSEVVPSEKTTCSQIKVGTRSQVIDGKNDTISSSCESASSIDRKRKAIRGHSLSDETIPNYQSKLRRVQDVCSEKWFYASPLIASNSKPSSNVQKLLENYKCTGLFKTLNMKFPRGVNLPSKGELEKKFSMFGLLDHSRTKIFFYTGVAQIVFLHPVDAQTAYRYVSRKKSFIHSDMHFWLVRDEKLIQEDGGQTLSLIGEQPKLKIQSCLRRPNINGEKNQKQKKRVRFSVDNFSGSSTTRKDSTCYAYVSEFPGKMIEDISGPLLQLLVKCDSLVEEAKEKLGSKTYYSCLYIQLLSSFRTES